MFNLERLTVKEWQREHGTTKSDEGGVRRAGLARATPSSTRRAERLRGAWFGCLLVLQTLVLFLPCPYPLFSTERGEDCRAETQAKTPTTIAI